MRCAACANENPPDARFCNACGARLEAGPAPGRRERKVVSALFADLVGFTGRAERLDPEDVRALLEPYHARLKHELERHGGTVEKFIGDAVMALFGAPVAHEDDPERAVRAALAIQAAVGGEPHVRIAVATGEALVTLDARPSEGEGMAAGDVVNTAARLQAAAPVDGVLVDDATYRATRDAILYREHEPVEAKGKAEPIVVWEALEPRARLGTDVAHDGRTPLVGRERELAVLTEALARVRAEKTPQLVTLIGVPGIGKSRLVWELQRHVDEDPELITWRQGRCLSYGEGVAFWALGEMVKAHAGLLESDTEAQAEARLAELTEALLPEAEREWVLAHLRPLAGLPGADGSSRDEAFAAWRRTLEALAEQRPTVLVFEDMHWADEGLLDFVDHLADWAVGVPLLVVCTARPELLERRPLWGGGKLNAVTLALSPLSDADSARLVGLLLDQPLLPADLQAALLGRAEGNPLYAEQYVRMLADRGLLAGGRLAADAELPLPDTLQSTIAARLDGLPAAEKLLLQDAAVYGKVFWAGALADDPAVLERLHQLERKGFVRRARRSSVADETEYAFAHALVRDVAYAQIPRLERARKHRTAAEWVERLAADRSEEHAQVAAYHWLEALELTRAAGHDDPELAELAVAALIEAGSRAQRLSANGAARDLFAKALALLPSEDPQRTALLYRFGRASVYAGFDADAELAEAAEALLAAGAVEEAADAIFARGWYRWNIGDDSSWALTEEAVRLVEDRPPTPIKAHVVGTYAVRLMLADRLDEALANAERELELAEAIGLERHRAHALISIGTIRAVSGDPAGTDAIAEGLELARELNDVPVVIRGYKNLASMLAQHGGLRRAESMTEEALAAATRFGDGFNSQWFEVELGHYAFFRGDWDGALRRFDRFLVRLGAARHYMQAVELMVRGRIVAERGAVEAGLAISAESLRLARGVGDTQALTPSLASHAWLELLAGHPVEAAALADEALLSSREASQSDADLACVLLDLGRLDALEALGSHGTWGEAAVALGRGDPARAAAIYREIGDAVHEADANVRLAHARAAAGETAEARHAADAAAAFYRRVGATRRLAEAETAASMSA